MEEAVAGNRRSAVGSCWQWIVVGVYRHLLAVVGVLLALVGTGVGVCRW